MSKGLAEVVQVLVVTEINSKGLVSRLDCLAVRLKQVKLRKKAQLLLKLGQLLRRKGKSETVSGNGLFEAVQVFQGETGLLPV